MRLAHCRPQRPILQHGQITLTELLAFPWLCSRIPARFAASLPEVLGAAGMIDPANGDFVPAVEVDVPMQPAVFLAGSNTLVFTLLSSVESELLAGDAVMVPVRGLELKCAYGFIYLNNRSLAPATQAYMAEVRALEAEIMAKEAMLANRFGLE
jgi:hypothetical protein